LVAGSGQGSEGGMILDFVFCIFDEEEDF